MRQSSAECPWSLCAQQGGRTVTQLATHHGLSHRPSPFMEPKVLQPSATSRENNRHHRNSYLGHSPTGRVCTASPGPPPAPTAQHKCNYLPGRSPCSAHPCCLKSGAVPRCHGPPVPVGGNEISPRLPWLLRASAGTHSCSWVAQRAGGRDAE